MKSLTLAYTPSPWPGGEPNLQLVSLDLLINHYRLLLLALAVSAIIIYEEHSFIHQLPTQEKIDDTVGKDLS